MIEILNGTHETVNYKPDTHIRLYVNDECEHYPPHWHSDMEVLCPLEGSYSAICADTAYVLQPGDMLFIAPGTIHDLLAAPAGVRIIFQISWSPLREISGLEAVLSRLSPAALSRRRILLSSTIRFTAICWKSRSCTCRVLF